LELAGQFNEVPVIEPEWNYEEDKWFFRQMKMVEGYNTTSRSRKELEKWKPILLAIFRKLSGPLPLPEILRQAEKETRVRLCDFERPEFMEVFFDPDNEDFRRKIKELRSDADF